MDIADIYAAQTDYSGAESVQYLFRQIMTQGFVGESLTQQILEQITPEPEPEITRQIEIEPER